MTKRTFGRGAAALVSVLALAPALVAVPAPAMAYTFSNVQIEGSQRIESATILSTAGIDRGQDLSAGDLNEAQQRLQQRLRQR